MKTKKHAEVYRIKEEIKSLYRKKSYLNSKLYRIHLQLLNNIHPTLLDYYLDFVNNDIQRVIRQMRSKQLNKFQRLVDRQQPRTNNFNCKHKFYTHLQNLTSIKLTNDETNLLNKGLMYNLPRYKSNFSREHIVAKIISAETVVKAIEDQNGQDEAQFLINNRYTLLI